MQEACNHNEGIMAAIENVEENYLTMIVHFYLNNFTVEYKNISLCYF